MFVFQCAFSGGQKYDGKDSAFVHAEYIVGLEVRGEADEDQVRDAAKNAIEFGAWSRFCDLFAVHNSQMQLRLPALSNHANITFVSLEEYNKRRGDDPAEDR